MAGSERRENEGTSSKATAMPASHEPEIPSRGEVTRKVDAAAAEPRCWALTAPELPTGMHTIWNGTKQLSTAVAQGGPSGTLIKRKRQRSRGKKTQQMN